MAVTLQQLEYFLAAVRLGTLSAAAEAHYIAQPSLSEQIRRLEATLGVPLFVRTNRQLVLTDAGRTFLPHAERTVAAAEEAAAAVQPIRTLTGGTVALGTFSSAPHLFHVDLVTRFRSQYPQVGLRLIAQNSVRIADAVRAGELEAGLVALPVDDRGLDVGPVRWRAEVAYLSADPRRAAAPRTIADLAAADLVLPEVHFGDADPTRLQLTALAQQAGVRLRPVVEVESPAVALDLARRGVGDTVVTLALARSLGMCPPLHAAPLDPPLVETFAVIRRRGSTLSPATRALLELAQQLLAELDRSGGG